MSTIGDQRQVEGIKLAVDVQKTCAAVSLASIAAFATYLKTTGIVLSGGNFFISILPIFLSLAFSLFVLIISTRKLLDGENPFGGQYAILVLSLSPVLLLLGLVIVFYSL